MADPAPDGLARTAPTSASELAPEALEEGEAEERVEMTTEFTPFDPSRIMMDWFDDASRGMATHEILSALSSVLTDWAGSSAVDVNLNYLKTMLNCLLTRAEVSEEREALLIKSVEVVVSLLKTLPCEEEDLFPLVEAVGSILDVGGNGAGVGCVQLVGHRQRILHRYNHNRVELTMLRSDWVKIVTAFIEADGFDAILNRIERCPGR
jgi:hypothetical protein